MGEYLTSLLPPKNEEVEQISPPAQIEEPKPRLVSLKSGVVNNGSKLLSAEGLSSKRETNSSRLLNCALHNSSGRKRNNDGNRDSFNDDGNKRGKQTTVHITDHRHHRNHPVHRGGDQHAPADHVFTSMMQQQQQPLQTSQPSQADDIARTSGFSSAQDMIMAQQKQLMDMMKRMEEVVAAPTAVASGSPGPGADSYRGRGNGHRGRGRGRGGRFDAQWTHPPITPSERGGRGRGAARGGRGTVRGAPQQHKKWVREADVGSGLVSGR